jgi:D-alanyl-D-alanine carboxypeptidase/D-alanyl-D-alanine-endopeptidase (penicillin-binding protein 4)
MNTRIVITLVLVLIISISAPAQSKYANLAKVVKQAANTPSLKYGQWSMYAINSKTGEVLVDINSQRGMAPASNLKLITSAAALELLGEGYTCYTYLKYDGDIDPSGQLQGNLYICGEGDPTLGSTEMQGVLALDSLMLDWTSRISSLGIKSINGDIIADDSFFDYMPTPANWFWNDIGNYFGAGTSGLCVNENLYCLYFRPGEKAGDPARILRTEPADIPDLQFINHMKTGAAGSGDNGYIYHAPWQWIHQLEGTIPAEVNEFSIKGSLPDPAKFAAQYLKGKLIASGIAVSGPALTIREAPPSNKERITFNIISSPPLKDIIYRLNKKSINIYAEQILKIMGKQASGGSSTDLESSLQVVQDWLQKNGVSTDGLFIHDGSGLSWLNRVTTLSFVQLLDILIKKPYFNTFYNSLPIAGDSADSGTMKNFCRGTKAAKNLRAKTGGIERVRTHTGYVRTRKGDLVCFSMMANDFSGSGRVIELLHEKIMIQLAELP